MVKVSKTKVNFSEFYQTSAALPLASATKCVSVTFEGGPLHKYRHHITVDQQEINREINLPTEIVVDLPTSEKYVEAAQKYRKVIGCPELSSKETVQINYKLVEDSAAIEIIYVAT